MPRVRFLTQVAGPGTIYWRRGDIADMSPEDAAKWCDGERAELVREEPAETPGDEPRMETTARRSRARTRKRG